MSRTHRITRIAAGAAMLLGALMGVQPHASAQVCCMTTTSTPRIVFSKSTEQLANGRYNMDIFTMNPDGTGLRRLTTDRGRDEEPTWNRARTKIAWMAHRPDLNANGLDIWVMNADGSSPRMVVSSSSADLDPSFSPDGTKIAFVRSVSGIEQIFVVNVDGTGVTRLTNATNHSFDPAFSPDGTKIAFSRTTAQAQIGVWVMNANGTSQTQVVASPGYNQMFTQPDWSPDGTKLAMRGPGGLYVKTLGSAAAPTMITSDGQNPSFSPDGGSLAFRSTLSVGTVSVNGQNRRIVSGDISIDPDWGFAVPQPTFTR